MRRPSIRVVPIVVVLLLMPLASVGGGAPQSPDSQSGSSGAELEPGPVGPERRMLDRIARKYEPKIRELEELSARIELAREAGDDKGGG